MIWELRGETRIGEVWRVESDVDRYDSREPLVVDLWIDHNDLDGEHSLSGAFLTPTQARELAERLLHNADVCENANARAVSSTQKGEQDG